MIKKYMNTDAFTAAQMLDITDADILEMSKGEYTSEDSDNTLNIVPSDFGNAFEKAGNNVRHVCSPVPFVNVNYIRGKRPVLSDMLHLDRATVEGIIYHSLCINRDTCKIEKVKDVSPKDCTSENYITGAEAIELLLKKKNQPTEKIILHNLPVLPLCLRLCIEDGGYTIFYSTESLYRRFLSRCDRYKILMALETPRIIIENEARLIQVYADQLINNGTCAVPFSSNGVPNISLADIADKISELTPRPKDSDTLYQEYSECLDGEKVKKLLVEYVELSKPFSSWEKYKEGVSLENQKKMNDAMLTVYESCRNLITNIKSKEFSEYSDFSEEMTCISEHGIMSYAEEGYINEIEEEQIVEDLIWVVYGQLQSFVKRRVQWFELDREKYKTPKPWKGEC